jgi:hypothetical protein
MLLLISDANRRAASRLYRCWRAVTDDLDATIWLIGEMVRERRITVEQAKAALNRMRLTGRRLPWDVAEKMLAAIDAPALQDI